MSQPIGRSDLKSDEDSIRSNVMGSCDGSSSVTDVTVELPADVKQLILECLSIEDAARTTLISTHCKDVWLQHGKLVFDVSFFSHRRNDPYKIINNILLHRAGPVKKFTIEPDTFLSLHGKLQQSDIDWWCLFLSGNGVEELILCFDYYRFGVQFTLPVCILSCPTLRHLNLRWLRFDCSPVNSHCIFPSATSLVFQNVKFTGNADGVVSSTPELEKLSFNWCGGINNFQISSRKLTSLSVTGFSYDEKVEIRWFTPHLKSIKTLHLSFLLVSCHDVEDSLPTFPTATNLQVVKLVHMSFACGRCFTFVLHLLQNSPNLLELEIESDENGYCGGTEEVLGDLETYHINRNLKMLNTLTMKMFVGYKLEMILLKEILCRSPALERVAIQEDRQELEAIEISDMRKEVLCCPRASTKVQFVFDE